jgi:hypothetical protein
MEHTSRERTAITNFVAGWLQDDQVEILHLEKIAREPSFGSHHDVWDVHLADRRLWVITEPTFAYDQRDIRSMDAAITFHVGLSHRIMSNHQPPAGATRVMDALATVRRRLEQTDDALEVAVEVDDLQAVGARAREALLAAARIMHADLARDGDEQPQLGNFLAWSERACEAWLPGKRNAHLRRTLRNATIDAWQAVNWLTHAQRATRAEAMICVTSAHHAVSLVELAMCAPRLSDPAHCARCGSRHLARVYHLSDDDSLKFTLSCDQCTWSSLEPQTETWQLGERIDDGDDSDCTTLEGFAETLTPNDAIERSDAARKFVRDRADQLPAAAADENPGWGNIYAVELPDGEVVDIHRALYWAEKGMTEPGVALLDTCGDDRCVNPDHALPTTLDDPAQGWHRVLVESIKLARDEVEIQLSGCESGRVLVRLDSEAQERLHLNDPSMWLERHLLVAHEPPDRVNILPVADAGLPGRTWPVAARVVR